MSVLGNRRGDQRDEGAPCPVRRGRDPFWGEDERAELETASLLTYSATVPFTLDIRQFNSEERRIRKAKKQR